MTYVGRFAPSPSGPLHFGSLVAAFGSWLDARANNGRWLVRVEDLDPPREMAGAIPIILDSLKAHGLEWDGEILYQSSRLKAYDDVLSQLSAQDLLYACTCTRKTIKANNGIHSRCQAPPYKKHADDDFALRLVVNNNAAEYNDTFHDLHQLELCQANEDYILKRKDGLHAYMLAVVADDIFQNVTHIIRGHDLAHTTCQQQYLFQQLEYTKPQFGHLPVALHPDGHKLSKQTHAPALDDSKPIHNLGKVLEFLNQPVPENLQDYDLITLLDWSVNHWQPELFKGLKTKQAA